MFKKGKTVLEKDIEDKKQHKKKVQRSMSKITGPRDYKKGPQVLKTPEQKQKAKNHGKSQKLNV